MTKVFVVKDKIVKESQKGMEFFGIFNKVQFWGTINSKNNQSLSMLFYHFFIYTFLKIWTWKNIKNVLLHMRGSL